ncbi:hypothetical protein R4K48_09520 [Brachyspira pulli]|uniref:hypothetical protein n=1 Tax=Brachyspira pulli TaxID=310721 RepID=UPI003006C916
MIKKILKLLFISIVTVVFISCANDTTDPNIYKYSYHIQVLVEKEEYLPVTIKANGNIGEKTIGSVTASEKNESGNYIVTIKNINIDTFNYNRIEVYKNNTILIHSEPISSFKQGELVQLKIY